MAVGDRLQNPISPQTGAAYAVYEVTNETGDSSGYKQAALLVKTVDDSGATVSAATNTGAANINAGQATAGAASGELVAARATRRGVTVRNTHATASCYIGEGTVTSANGFLLKAGESIALYTVAAVNGIRDTADVTVCFIEEYD